MLPHTSIWNVPRKRGLTLVQAPAGTAGGIGQHERRSAVPDVGQDREHFRWSSLLLLTPSTVLLLLLFIGPLAYAFYLGFTNMELIGPRSQHYSFTGTANILRMMHDSSLDVYKRQARRCHAGSASRSCAARSA